MPRRLTLVLCLLASRCAFADPLVDGFEHPPAEARPRLWWHWLGGNVTLSGIDQDLAWMHRIGVGGVQMFDGNLGTPVLVDTPRPFGSPLWQEAVQHAAQRAGELGLELSITTSAGWSAAGGPWVTPEDGMKKLVWSGTRITAGAALPVALPAPPAVSGPFQNVSGPVAQAPWYRDTRVLAWPVRPDEAPLPVAKWHFSAPGIDRARLERGDLAKPQALALDSQGRAVVELTYPTPQTVRSLVLGLPAPTGFGTPPPPTARLQWQDAAMHWQTAAEVPASTSPQRTVSFPGVRAQRFRVVFEAARGSGLPPAPAGVIGMALPAAPASIALARLELHRAGRVNHAEEQAGFALAPDYFQLATPSAGPDSTVPVAEVRDISRYLDRDGRLHWAPPAGQWQVLRLGYSLTGHQNGPAAAEATGLEVDKLDADAEQRYLDHYLSLFPAKGISGLLADSIESGPQNWTPRMLEAFAQRRGYDATPWLPALTGVIVENAAATDRFLFDWRNTLSELTSDQYYATLARAARQRGWVFYSEALEDHRPQLGDDLAMRSHADVPMGALWALDEQGQGRATYVADVLGAASIAHLQGKSRVGAESFGAFLHPFDYTPRDLKPTADLALALGVNLFNLHTSPHQPQDTPPGLPLAPLLGQAFSRHESWARDAGAWIDYLARSSFVMQQGRHQADLLYFIGEEAPVTALYGEGLPQDLPAGYGFDFVSAASLDLLEADHGQLRARSGNRYALLYLGGSSQRLSVAVLERLVRWQAAGVTVVGERPVASPSQADDPVRWQGLVDRLWGQGLVLSGIGPEPALQRLGLRPDLSFSPAAPALRFQHRSLADGRQVWFVHNTGQVPVQRQASFRVQGLNPARWDAVSGERYALPARERDGRTEIPLSLPAQGSMLVVFAPERLPPQPAEISREAVPGTWTLEMAGRTLQPGGLGDWAGSADSGMRYFSGTARYSLTFSRLEACPRDCVLDLGEVRDLARVRLNGQDLGVLWVPPYRLRVPLKAGINQLEVDVSNPWRNRLIGDAQTGAQMQLRGAAGLYKANAPLRPGGLLGPVSLLRVTPL